MFAVIAVIIAALGAAYVIGKVITLRAGRLKAAAEPVEVDTEHGQLLAGETLQLHSGNSAAGAHLRRAKIADELRSSHVHPLVAVEDLP